jgi:hypothetical protein
MNEYQPCVSARPVHTILPFTLISYAKLAHDLRAFNFRDVLQGRLYRVNGEMTLRLHHILTVLH